MIGKVLEAFFRHKLVVLLPMVLIPAIAGTVGFWLRASYYESAVGLWVSRPTLLRYDDGSSPWITPAQLQTQRLTELMRTRSFRAEVAGRTSLAPLVSAPGGDERLAEFFARQVVFGPNGENLMGISARGDTPQRSFELVNAVVETFKERASADAASQGEIAIAFYANRLREAEAQLNQSGQTLRRYVQANPRLTDPSRSTTAAGLSTAVVDPQFSELRYRLEADQEEVRRARQALEQADLGAAAAREGRELGWQVVDAPQMPTTLTRTPLRRTLIFPLAGIAAGLILSAVLLVLLVARDRTARSEPDLGGTRVVGVIPSLKVDRLPRSARQDATRRAIGFVAGTALPAPGGTQ